MRHRSLVVTAVLALPASAAAQAADGPVFLTMARPESTSTAGVDLGVGLLDIEDEAIQTLRIDVHGTYVHTSGFGGYVTLPISFAFADDESEGGISNLELGGVYVYRLPNGSVTGFLGLVLPTAPEEDLFVNILATFPRLTDAPLALSTTTWLRVGGSPMIRTGDVFVRGDLGVDIPIDDGDTEGELFLVDAESAVRFNAAAGFDLGSAILAVELVNVGRITGDETDSDDLGDRFAHTFGLTARFRAGNIRPGVGLVIPLDDAVRGDIWALIASLEVAIPAM